MKYKLGIISIFLLVMNISIGQSMVKYEFQLEQNEITIIGTSNLHDWESIVEKSTAKLVFRNYETKTIEKLSLVIDVASIKNTKGHKVMDRLTRKALKSKDFPEITYVFVKGNLISDTTKEIKVELTGDLTIAGKTRQVSVISTIDKLASGVSLDGEHELRMTDYGVKPPTALFGTVKTADEITIRFSIKF